MKNKVIGLGLAATTLLGGLAIALTLGTSEATAAEQSASQAAATDGESPCQPSPEQAAMISLMEMNGYTAYKLSDVQTWPAGITVQNGALTFDLTLWTLGAPVNGMIPFESKKRNPKPPQPDKWITCLCNGTTSDGCLTKAFPNGKVECENIGCERDCLQRIMSDLESLGEVGIDLSP